MLNTLLKVAPWKITGPASGPEWQEVPIGAEDYRVVAPACVPPRPPALPGASLRKHLHHPPNEAKSFAKIAEVFRRLSVPSRTFVARESLLIFSSSHLLIFPNIFQNIFPNLLVFQNRSQPATVQVPWAESDRVYDVRYHSRDARRKFEPVLHGVVGSTVEVTPATLTSLLAENAGDVSALAPGARHGSQDPGAIGSEYRLAPHLEQTNGGYT